MGCGVLRVSIWALFVFSLVYCSRGFDPVDQFYINCGSPHDVSIGNVTFVADKSASKYLSTPQDILADSHLNSIASVDGSPLFRTARIFTGTSNYTFPIKQRGRHWIRLHFFPFIHHTYDLKSSKFSVFSQKTTLLSDFTPKNEATVMEYSVSLASGDLEITFLPSGNSPGYINAIEVVSQPDTLFTDDARLFNPPGPFSGLKTRSLETMVRLNMGGPLVTSVNDTLGRTWDSDSKFLLDADLTTTASRVAAMQYPDNGTTPDTAPPTVYGTCRKQDTDHNPYNIINVTWDIPVDSGFQYFIRLHFCDFLSTAVFNHIVFNVYIDASEVAPDLDLISRNEGRRAVATFLDFVTPLIDKSNIIVIVGASRKGALPDAILNGLEIMKMSNSKDSLAATSAMPSFPASKKKKKMKTGVILGVSVGVVVPLMLLGVFFFLVHKTRK